MHVARSDGIDGLDDLPLFVLVRHRALDDRVATSLETLQSPWRAQQLEVAPPRLTGAYRIRRCRAGRDEGRALPNRAVAVDAVDFHGCARLGIDLPIAVIVLCEVAVTALHALVEVDVGKMHSFPKPLGVIEGDGLSVFIEP